MKSRASSTRCSTCQCNPYVQSESFLEVIGLVLAEVLMATNLSVLIRNTYLQAFENILNMLSVHKILKIVFIMVKNPNPLFFFVEVIEIYFP